VCNVREYEIALNAFLDHLFVDGLPVRAAPRAKCTALVKRMYACLIFRS
jgi:hypothetical protein